MPSPRLQHRHLCWRGAEPDSDSAAESTDDAAASENSGDSGDSGGTGPKICMVTHGDGGGFWSVAKAGADKAGEDLPVQFTYQETTNDAQLQAQLIESFISEGCEGIAVSAPNPDAISDALAKADEAGIAIVTMNSGSKVFKDLGAFTHVGQDEFIAGQEAGLKFKEAGNARALPDPAEHRAGRRRHVRNVENLQLDLDIALSQAARRSGHRRCSPPTSLPQPAAEVDDRHLDLSGEAVQSIADGDLASPSISSSTHRATCPLCCCT